MSEVRWLQSNQPYELLRIGRKVASSRQLQLIAMSAFQLLDASLTELQRKRVQGMESVVWQNATPIELQAQFNQHYQQILEETQAWQQQFTSGNAMDDEQRLMETVIMSQAAMIGAPVDMALYRVIDWVTAHAAREAGPGLARAARKQFHRSMVAIFHEVLGNPFAGRVAVGPRSPVPPLSWQMCISETADAMARGIVAQRAFDRMPILADVLEEDGCRDLDLLGHLRSPEMTHLAGCWALDFVLQVR
jgi:hypothetical protein